MGKNRRDLGARIVVFSSPLDPIVATTKLTVSDLMSALRATK